MRALALLILEKALAIVLGLFLLLTLFRGGNTELAIRAALGGGILLLLLCLTVLLLGGHHGRRPGGVSLGFLTALLLLLGFGLAGLVLLGVDTWLALPGRDVYTPIIQLLALPELDVKRLPFTLDEVGSLRAVMVACICLAVALAAQLLGRSSLLALLGAISFLAILEAIIGFLQLGFRGAASVFVLEYAGHARASGTFVNKNHYATLLAMTLPVLILRSAGHFSFFMHGNRSNTLANLWWGVAAALVGAALIASLSRAGVLAGAIASAAAVGLCLYRQGELSRRGVMLGAGVLVLFMVLVAAVGLQGMVKSISSTALLEGVSSRGLMNAQTWTGVVAFFPLGAGLGSYSIAFPRFQQRDLVGYVEYAHNDYLQLLFETGAIGVVVLGLIGFAGAMTAARLWRLARSEERLPAGVAALLGVTAFAIHAWFDFPAHIPAIAIIATLLFSASMNPELNIVGRKRRVAERFDSPLLREAVPFPRPAQVPAGESLPVVGVDLLKPGDLDATR